MRSSKISALLINLLLDSFQHFFISHMLALPLPNCLQATVNKLHKERLSHRFPHQPPLVLTPIQLCQEGSESK